MKHTPLRIIDELVLVSPLAFANNEGLLDNQL
jgi:hypothetical protein